MHTFVNFSLLLQDLVDILYDNISQDGRRHHHSSCTMHQNKVMTMISVEPLRDDQ